MKVEKLTHVLSRRPLVSFFALAYLGSWVAWSPWWLSESGIGLLRYELPFAAVAGINQLGLFAGPFTASLLVTRVVEGKEGLRRFTARLFRWRVGPLWWVLALGAVPLATGLGYLLMSGSAFAFAGGAAVIGTLIATFFIYLLGGPLQEEPGWRGFALPRLQARMHPFTAALVLGVLHCFWHAPLFLTDEWDTARHDPGQFAAYFILVVSMSFVLSWIANGSGGSILLTVLAHNSVNWAFIAASTVGGVEFSDNWPAALGLAAFAAFAILITRGRLGQRGRSVASSAR